MHEVRLVTNQGLPAVVKAASVDEGFRMLAGLLMMGHYAEIWDVTPGEEERVFPVPGMRISPAYDQQRHEFDLYPIHLLNRSITNGTISD